MLVFGGVYHCGIDLNWIIFVFSVLELLYFKKGCKSIQKTEASETLGFGIRLPRIIDGESGDEDTQQNPVSFFSVAENPRGVRCGSVNS